MTKELLPLASTLLLITACNSVVSPSSESTTPCTGDENFEQGMLCAHNEVRDTVLDPKPESALPSMTWDDSLTTIAQNYADLCIWEHNSNRSDDYPGQVGENLYASTNVPGHSEAVNNWASELADYDYETDSCEPGKACGHYTQLVWRTTTKVGCAISQCDSIQGIPDWTEGGYMVVCDYSPAGNYIGEKPY